MIPDPVWKLASAVPQFRVILDQAGEPPSRHRPAGFETLLHIIIQQQLSLASAAAIWGRFKDYIQPMSAAAVLQADPDALRRIGLSHAKIRYSFALAEAVQNGRVDFDQLQQLYGKGDARNPEAGIGMLTGVKGIGRWTAEIYLLAAHDHPDIMPAADIALQVAAESAFALPTRPREKELRDLAEAWAPVRSAAARLLWHHYRHLKGRDTAL